MGASNPTHYDGQIRAQCPGCGRSIRLTPPHAAHSDTATVHCGGCNTNFTSERE